MNQMIKAAAPHVLRGAKAAASHGGKFFGQMALAVAVSAASKYVFDIFARPRSAPGDTQMLVDEANRLEEIETNRLAETENHLRREIDAARLRFAAARYQIDLARREQDNLFWTTLDAVRHSPTAAE